MRERSLTWKGKLLLSVLSPLVVLGLLELGLRLAGFRYEPSEEYLTGRTYTELQQTALYEADPDLLWRLRPSSVLDLPDHGFFEAHTNSLGLRGPEFAPGKEPGEFRVLCLGESVSFGVGLRDGDTWPVRMEEALRAAPELKGRPVRVINGAVPGWSSVQGRRLFERLRYLDPDVVVFWFGFADSHQMRGLPDSAQRFPAEGLPLTLRPAWRLRLFQLVEKFVTKARAVVAEGTRVSEEEFRANVAFFEEVEAAGGPEVIFVHEPEQADLTIAQMERILARAEEVGADHMIGPGPLLSWILPAPPDADFTGTRCQWHGEPAIVFDPFPHSPRDPNYEMLTTDVRSDYEMLKLLKRNFDRILSNLPEDRIGYADLFGDHRPEEVFQDNCHLSPLGARLAGKRMAREAIRRALRRSDGTVPPASAGR